VESECGGAGIPVPSEGSFAEAETIQERV